MKICAICKFDKLVPEDFNKNKTKSDGFQDHCKECSRKRSANHYKNNKQDYLNNRDIRRIKLAQFVWNYLKEHPCVDCGEKDPIVLEFDHRDNKKYNISVMAGRGFSHDTLLKEIAKCDVRCANCHRRKTAIQFNYHRDVIK